MFDINSNNIYQTFAPLHCVLKVFGLATYQLDLDNRVLKVSKNKIYITICCIFYIFLLSINVYWGEQEPDAEESLLIKHGWHKMYLIEMICLIVITIVNYNRQDTTIKCLELFHEFDQTKESFAWKHSLNHSKERRVCILFIVGFIIYWIIVLSISVTILDPDERDFVHLMSLASYLLCSQMTVIIGYQFIFFCGCLKSRFEILLRNIEDNFSFLSQNEILSNMELLKTLHLINNIYVCHTTLNKILKNINSLYSFQVSLWKIL